MRRAERCSRSASRAAAGTRTTNWFDTWRAPGPTAGVAGADRLRGVLDDREAVRAGDLVDRVHVGRLAVEVDRDHGPRAGRDRVLEPGRVEVERLGLDVDEDRPGPGPPDRA